MYTKYKFYYILQSEAQELQERLQNAKQKCRKANEELKEKDQLLAQLSDQYSKLTKQTNRFHIKIHHYEEIFSNNYFYFVDRHIRDEYLK